MGGTQSKKDEFYVYWMLKIGVFIKTSINDPCYTMGLSFFMNFMWIVSLSSSEKYILYCK